MAYMLLHRYLHETAGTVVLTMEAVDAVEGGDLNSGSLHGFDNLVLGTVLGAAQDRV
jgi:hypothetical protein